MVSEATTTIYQFGYHSIIILHTHIVYESFGFKRTSELFLNWKKKDQIEPS